MTPLEAFAQQVAYCDKNNAPVTAALVQALADSLDLDTHTGRTVLGWRSNPLGDALPLRLAGGVHDAWRTGDAAELAGIFDGSGSREANTGAMRAFVARADAALLPWLDGPPQTNEPGRSAQLMAGLIEIAARHGPKLEILELGSSAGLNLLIGRYRIALPGIATGPADSPVRLMPEWRGPPPPGVNPEIVGIRGVDIAPVDATTDIGARRLLAYVWADHTQRFERLAHALDLLRAHPPHLDAGHAADWLEARLAEPQSEGVTRVVMHSIVWQYIDAAGQARITAAMESAGSRASAQRPLGWVRVEANRTMHQHEITVRSWPGHAASTLIGFAHAHGFWVERLAEPVIGHELP